MVVWKKQCQSFEIFKIPVLIRILRLTEILAFLCKNQCCSDLEMNYSDVLKFDIMNNSPCFEVKLAKRMLYRKHTLDLHMSFNILLGQYLKDIYKNTNV